MTGYLFDIIIVSIITIFSLVGLYNGFVKMSFYILGFIFSIILSNFSYKYVNMMLCNLLFDYPSINLICTIIITYSLSLLITNLLVIRIFYFVSPIFLGVLNNILGFFLGFIKGCLISLIFFIITLVLYNLPYIEFHNIYWTLYIHSAPNFINESIFLDYFNESIYIIYSIIDSYSLDLILNVNKIEHILKFYFIC